MHRPVIGRSCASVGPKDVASDAAGLAFIEARWVERVYTPRWGTDGLWGVLDRRRCLLNVAPRNQFKT
jgi:hypothetical protein